MRRAQSVHGACISRGQSVHGEFTELVRSMQRACTGVDGPCTGRAWSLHGAFPERAQSMHGACTGRAQGMHRTCTERAQSVHGACKEHAQSVHGACTGRARSMHRACTEDPLLKDLIDLGTEATWSSFNTFSTQDNHGLGKFDLNSGGAGDQVAARQSWPSLSVPHSSVDKVLEDQAAVDAPR